MTDFFIVIGCSVSVDSKIPLSICPEASNALLDIKFVEAEIKLSAGTTNYVHLQGLVFEGFSPKLKRRVDLRNSGK